MAQTRLSGASSEDDLFRRLTYSGSDATTVAPISKTAESPKDWPFRLRIAVFQVMRLDAGLQTEMRQLKDTQDMARHPSIKSPGVQRPSRLGA